MPVLDLPRFPAFKVTVNDGSTEMATSCPCGTKYGAFRLPGEDPVAEVVDTATSRLIAKFADIGHADCVPDQDSA